VDGRRWDMTILDLQKLESEAADETLSLISAGSCIQKSCNEP
jgi:hypothetical protein